MVDFAAQVRDWTEKVKGRETDLVREVSFDLAFEMIAKDGPKKTASPGTPVDTGNARNHWYASIGSPGAGPQGDRQGGDQSLSEIGLVLAGVEAGQVVYVLNNAAYIRRLEYEGHSQQAPQGFVRLAFAGAQRVVDDAVRRIRESG